MLARIRKSMQEKDQGFTLIELLVVMIIIGILAAIAIPTFLNQRTKARETSAKSDVTTIGKEVAAYYVDGTDALTLSSASGTWTLVADGTTVTSGPLTVNGSTPNVATGSATSATDFCVQVVSSDGTNTDAPQSYTETGLQPGVGC